MKVIGFVTLAQAGGHVREELDSRFRGNDVIFEGGPILRGRRKQPAVILRAPFFGARRISAVTSACYRVPHLSLGTALRQNSRELPSLLGRGCPVPALSPAGTGRVRGRFPGEGVGPGNISGCLLELKCELGVYNCRMRACDVLKTLPALEGPNSSTLSGSAESLVAPSVGGGHKKRALAHGYSIRTPSGFGRSQRWIAPALPCLEEKAFRTKTCCASLVSVAMFLGPTQRNENCACCHPRVSRGPSLLTWAWIPAFAGMTVIE